MSTPRLLQVLANRSGASKYMEAAIEGSQLGGTIRSASKALDTAYQKGLSWDTFAAFRSTAGNAAAELHDFSPVVKEAKADMQKGLERNVANTGGWLLNSMFPAFNRNAGASQPGPSLFQNPMASLYQNTLGGQQPTSFRPKY